MFHVINVYMSKENYMFVSMLRLNVGFVINIPKNWFSFIISEIIFQKSFKVS